MQDIINSVLFYCPGRSKGLFQSFPLLLQKALFLGSTYRGLYNCPVFSGMLLFLFPRSRLLYFLCRFSSKLFPKYYRSPKERDEFYWPQTLGSVSEDQALPVFSEYIALGECNTPQQYISGATNYYRTEVPPKFNLHMEDVCRFSTLPVQGYWVENGARDDETRQVGPNKLMHNGTLVRFAGDNSPVQTYGNIFLCEDNGVAYCAFNRWKWVHPDEAGISFYQLRI